MIHFEKVAQKEWKILFSNKEILNLKMISSSVTNKFQLVTTFIERVSETCGNSFDEWFVEFIEDYVTQKEHRYPILLRNISYLKGFVDEYFEKQQIDFTQFVDVSKVKKNSILFTADEIEIIAKLSGYLKIYSIFSNSEKFKLSQRLHRKVYNKIADDILRSDVVRKIHEVIKTKTFKYNLTDRYMWDYINKIQCKSIDVHVVEIFNFVMNSILVLCEENKNPITYFVGVVDESVKWFLRSVYKGLIIYDDSMSTEDIHGSNTNNLRTYSYNDTLGRLKGIAFEQIYENIERSSIITFDQEPNDTLITEFQSRVSKIQYISPLCECFVYPLLSAITSIPYTHFMTLSPEHAAALSVYTQGLFKDIFKSEFKNLVSLLEFYPENQPAVATSYTIKKVHEYINTSNNLQSFFGFNTKILPHKILSYFVGRISRVNFHSILDGKPLSGIPLSKVELDMIKFYTMFFANQYEKEIKLMRKKMNLDF